MSTPHLSLSLSRELWNGMLRAALPYDVARGEVSLLGVARATVKQLGVRERVEGLLEGGLTPPPVARLGEAALALWRDRKPDVVRRVDRLVHIEGTWQIAIDDLGTEIVYGPQKLTAEAWVKAVADGKITLLTEGLTFPFHIEQRLGATVALGRIRYARDRQAILANVQDVALHLGDAAWVQVVGRLVEVVLARQLGQMEAVPVLKREQLESLLGPVGGPLKVLLEVADLFLAVDEERMTLEVRFGFAKAPDAPRLGDGGEGGVW